mmetsp:Transcript_59296/g.117507  ORF Transcript_59296/g.117507 Transcript_59296/m.117507 type:complete len:124 (-) Transcript_59296:7-378(-)
MPIAIWHDLDTLQDLGKVSVVCVCVCAHNLAALFNNSGNGHSRMALLSNMMFEAGQNRYYTFYIQNELAPCVFVRWHLVLLLLLLCVSSFCCCCCCCCKNVEAVACVALCRSVPFAGAQAPWP